MLEYAFLVFIVVVVAFVATSKKKSFPVNTIVFENRANGLIPFMTKSGRHATKDGKYFYKIKYPKFPFGQVKKTSPFDFESLMIDNKGKNLLLLYSPEPDIYAPLDMVREVKQDIIVNIPVMKADGSQDVDEQGNPKFEERSFPKIFIKGLKADVREFIAEETARAQIIYINKKNLFDRYMPLILMIMFSLGIAIIIYSAGDMLMQGSSLMNEAAKAAAGAKSNILGQTILS
jgi:hypothetical protein